MAGRLTSRSKRETRFLGENRQARRFMSIRREYIAVRWNSGPALTPWRRAIIFRTRGRSVALRMTSIIFGYADRTDSSGNSPEAPAIRWLQLNVNTRPANR